MFLHDMDGSSKNELDVRVPALELDGHLKAFMSPTFS